MTRKNGELTGSLSDPTDKSSVIPMESVHGIDFSFTAQGFNENLAKVDQNNLKGKMMDMFDATAVRM